MLAALTCTNTLNYVDRYVVTALLPNMALDLQLSDAAGGLLAAAFMGVYLVCSPLMGMAGDRGHRPRWLGAGVVLWSLATAAGGLARSLPQLLAARAAVGVGEAACGSIAPSLLADSFRPAQRGRILSVFGAAMPLGAAAGYLLGGLLGTQVGWRCAFFWVGLPGLLMAGWAWRLPDPPRGLLDEGGPPPGEPQAVAGDDLKGLLRRLWQHRRYRSTVAGFTAYTFALGGMAFWMPTYLMRVHHRDQAGGMLLFGGVTVLCGLVGTLGGGWLGDGLRRRRADGYAHLSILSAVGAALAGSAMLMTTRFAPFMAALALAELMAFACVGPINAILVDSVPASGRATAMAVCILVIHLLGDAISPLIIGALSDRYGLRAALGAVPAFFLLAALAWRLGPQAASTPGR